jgi:hypothetical protein
LNAAQANVTRLSSRLRDRQYPVMDIVALPSESCAGRYYWITCASTSWGGRGGCAWIRIYLRAPSGAHEGRGIGARCRGAGARGRPART